MLYVCSVLFVLYGKHFSMNKRKLLLTTLRSLITRYVWNYWRNPRGAF